MINERGSTMVEVLGVVAIIGTLAMGVWHLINDARYKYKLSVATLQIQGLAKNITRFYASEGNYDDLNTSGSVQKLSQSGVVPRSMQAGIGIIGHSFNGDVTLRGIGENFSITFKNLSEKVCMELATLAWQKTDKANLIFIKIGDDEYGWPIYNGVSEDEEDLSVSERYLPVSMTEAADSCASSDNGLIDIEWTFR